MSKSFWFHQFVFAQFIQIMLQFKVILSITAINLSTGCQEKEYRVRTSEANPPIPKYNLGWITEILGKSMPNVVNCCPSLLSEAIATQFLPAMATRVPPLYSDAD